MALIKCEECGQMVSDKAIACPHCGCPMQSQNESVNPCPECGQTLPKMVSICPNCGCPVEKMNESSNQTRYQEDYVYSFDPDEEPNRSKRNIIWTIAALATIVAFGIYFLSELGYFKKEVVDAPKEEVVEAAEEVIAEEESSSSLPQDELGQQYQERNEQENKANRLERFCGKYIFPGYNNKNNWTYEVLPDGRFILIDHIIATGEEVKKYIGTIVPVSDAAFKIKATGGSDLCSSSTPICVFRDGQDHEIGHTERGGTPLYLIVFDVEEGRAYREGLDSYNSRDISEVEYYKFIH